MGELNEKPQKNFFCLIIFFPQTFPQFEQLELIRQFLRFRFIQVPLFYYIYMYNFFLSSFRLHREECENWFWWAKHFLRLLSAELLSESERHFEFLSLPPPPSRTIFFYKENDWIWNCSSLMLCHVMLYFSNIRTVRRTVINCITRTETFLLCRRRVGFKFGNHRFSLFLQHGYKGSEKTWPSKRN